MATLLHLDSAVFPQGSASREVTAAFFAAWREQHPDGQVVYRDLAANPLPHLDAPAVIAGAEDALRGELAGLARLQRLRAARHAQRRVERRLRAARVGQRRQRGVADGLHRLESAGRGAGRRTRQQRGEDKQEGGHSLGQRHRRLRA